MIVAGADLHRLVVRVAVVTLALRAVSLFSTDAFALEVEAMLAAAGGAEPGRVVVAALTALGGSIAAVGRLPTLLADLGVVLAVMAYARAAGWGTIAGLLAGAVAAMAPFGLAQGWRASAHFIAPMAGMLGLWQLRGALRRGVASRAWASAGAMSVATFFCAPALVLLPSAWWLSARSVAMPAARLGGALGWTGAALLGLGARALVLGGAGPVVSDATAWIAASAGIDGGIGASDVADVATAAASALSAFGVGGPVGDFAVLAEMAPAPAWRLALTAALGLVAVFGLARGLVREDPAAPPPRAAPLRPSEVLKGAADADDWRSLGVAVATAPRALGERDWMPLLLPSLCAAAYAAWQADAGSADGVLAAAAMARPTAALFIGVGVAAAAMLPSMDEDAGGKGQSRAVWLLSLAAAAIFAAGGHAMLSSTAAVASKSPRKVAAFVAAEFAGGEAVLIGAGGLRVRWKLAGGLPSERLRLAAPTLDAASAAVGGAVRARVDPLVLAGDRAILGELGAVAAAGSAAAIGLALDRQLAEAGYVLREDGHRYLGDLAVRVYGRADGAGAVDRAGAATVRPQLAPGVAP